MKYLITGVNGQLGHDLYKILDDGENEILAPSSIKMNLMDPVTIINTVCEFKPDVIIHAAAYTAVDRADESIKEGRICYKTNYKGTKYLTEAAKMVNAKMIYVSSDYVFDGKKLEPYKETDKTNPLNLYGYTKLLGEEAVLDYEKGMVVRTQWVFGINGKNFVKTMLKLATSNESVRVVSDQFGAPTYTRDLAKKLVLLSETDEYGIYHASNTGNMSWYQFAKFIFNMTGANVRVDGIRTFDYKQTAVRPLNTTLDKNKMNNLVGIMPDSLDALERYIYELKQDEEMKLVLEKVENKWKK